MANISIVQANRVRASHVASSIVQRLEFAGLWAGYSPIEHLEGELRESPNGDFITYWRRESPLAKLVFWNPVMCDIKEVDWGKEDVVQQDVIEREEYKVDNPTEVEVEHKASHTFSKTRSLLEAAKLGAELAIKASASAKYAVVEGSVEVSAKITAEYDRQWGEQQTNTDTVEDLLKIPANTSIQYEAIRSLDKTQRKISAKTDFSFSRISLIDETGAGVNPPRIDIEWASWTEFLAVAQGIAPADKMMYHQFMDNPLTEDEFEVLKLPSDEIISYVADYDHVVNEDIRLI